MGARDAEAPPSAAAGSSVAAHMSRRVLTVRGDCPLEIAMATVRPSGHRHVVVVDARGAYEGVLRAEVITTSGMARLGQRPQLVRDLITVPPVHVSPEASMHAAASVMMSYSVDAAGVLDSDGQAVGVLSWADIVAMVAERERA